MTRRLIAFNLLLAVLIFAAGWRLRTTWLERVACTYGGSQ